MDDITKLIMEQAKIILNGIEVGIGEVIVTSYLTNAPKYEIYPGIHITDRPSQLDHTVEINKLQTPIQNYPSRDTEIQFPFMRATAIVAENSGLSIEMKTVTFDPQIVRRIVTLARVSPDEARRIMTKLSLYDQGEYMLVRRPKKKKDS